ncbi:uncharacterized protein LOC131327851 [Rhododendron vialii]|uniref:uncharacterized protein LOC131327851 n=1 Tax=Rhododendron vialii TaxID=182163 RepID=UPI0026605864|nr:uncharacterized protein LOC131327851 [Rhododendron vialii]
MEAFTALLRSRVDMGPFSFHPKRRSIGLTHLVFADDLFILCGASQDSFSLINQLLTNFHSFSGLKPNMQKSSVFYVRVFETVKLTLSSILPIPEAHLLVKYLGVSLISTRLKAADCLILKEKILKRIQGWSNRPVSYRGRAQLIQLVLFSVQVYWSSIFVIPSKTIKEIESTLMAFLWSSLEMKSYAAKVQWYHVCSPKEEGGLSFRRIKEWNKATMLRHLWAICNKADTLWVKWIHNYIIKGQCFWSMDIPSDASWTMRKVLNLRSLGQSLIKYQVGNGQNTHLWLDNWHPLGPLFKRFGESVVYNLGKSLLSKVSFIIHNGAWRWPRQRNRVTQFIVVHTPVDSQPNCLHEDSVVWLPHPSGFSVFSA